MFAIHGISVCTKYWNRVDQRYQYHARQRETPQDGPAALRKLAKKANLNDIGIGGIFHTDLFPQIVQETQYKATVLAFKSKEDLAKKIKLALKLQIPFILSVDMDGYWIANRGGKKAHYITVVGYITEAWPGDMSLVYVSDGQYYIDTLGAIYSSLDRMR